MQPRIATLQEKKLIGKRIKMSFSHNRTFELWHGFMPYRKEIMNNIGSDLYSVEIYPSDFFDNIDPDREFEKWAGIEVKDFNARAHIVPDGMETLDLPGGLYAVFLYKGPASAAQTLYQSIFTNWLPNSAYLLDNRPHFALMGNKYKNEDPDSEEEIYIPVKPKTEA